jgi:hypothetical protein
MIISVFFDYYKLGISNVWIKLLINRKQALDIWA